MFMKLFPILFLASCLLVRAETEEAISKRFTVQSNGKLVVDVSFGAITVNTHASSEVMVDVLRKVGRNNKEDEETFLAEHPVTITQDGDVITIHSRAENKKRSLWGGRQRLEAKYDITVPGQFNAQVKTAGGAIVISDLTGEVKADTSGGALKFSNLKGPLDGTTSGGSIRVTDCQGALKVDTSGGGIQVSGGSGNLHAETSGGSIAVKGFKGSMQSETSGGGITVEDVSGRVQGSTSGGSISARFSSPVAEEVKLETAGGGVTVRVAENSAFDLDAVTSGGGVSSDLTVNTDAKPTRGKLKGPVNGGGKPMILRTSGGSIQVTKL